MGERTCPVIMNDGRSCDRPVKTSGLCGPHYDRQRRGYPLDVPFRRQSPAGTPAYDKVIAMSIWDGNCFVFTGDRTPKGYGHIGLPTGGDAYAHRVVAAHFLGESNLKVLHSCDNPPCVNIDHLRYGTPADNMADAISRGRMKGIALTDEDVIAIRADPRSQRIIAAEYGCSRSYVGDIKSGRYRASV